MDRMKSIVPSYVYRSNVNDDLEQYVRQCRSCTEAAKSSRKTTLESWPVSTQSWDRMHIDYAGPMDGFYYLVIVMWVEDIPEDQLSLEVPRQQYFPSWLAPYDIF